MIHIPDDYNTARAYDGSNALTLPAGGHICKIISARQDTAKTGTEMLVVAFDIAEGGMYDGYYTRKHERSMSYRTDAKFPGVFRAPVTTKDGKTSGYFKGLITAIEESNPGFRFVGDEKTLSGKAVAFNFGEEEWRKSDGTVGVSVKPFYAVSVQRAREGIQPPARKVLNDSQAQMERQGFTPVDAAEEPLPF